MKRRELCCWFRETVSLSNMHNDLMLRYKVSSSWIMAHLIVYFMLLNPGRSLSRPLFTAASSVYLPDRLTESNRLQFQDNLQSPYITHILYAKGYTRQDLPFCLKTNQWKSQNQRVNEETAYRLGEQICSRICNKTLYSSWQLRSKAQINTYQWMRIMILC